MRHRLVRRARTARSRRCGRRARCRTAAAGRARRVRRAGGKIARRGQACRLRRVLPVQLRLPVDPSLALSTPRTGTAATPATRPRSTRQAAELAPTSAACGWWTGPGRRGCRPASPTWSPGTLALLPGARPGPLAGQQRELPRPGGQAAGHHPRADPPRHAAQGDGPGPGRLPGRRGTPTSPRSCAASTGGTSASSRQPAHHRRVGAGLPVPARDAGGRLPAQRPAGGRHGRGHRRGREKLGLRAGPDASCSTRRPTAMAADGTPGARRRGPRRAARAGHGAAGAGALLLRPRTPRHRRRSRAGHRRVRRTPWSRTSIWPRTC